MSAKQRTGIDRKLKAAAKIRRLAIRRATSRHRAARNLRNATSRKSQVAEEAEKSEVNDVHSNITEGPKSEPGSVLDSVCLRPETCSERAAEVLPSRASDRAVTSDRSEPSSNFLSQLVPVTYPVHSLRTTTFSLRYLFKNVLSNEDQCVRWLASHGLLRNEQLCSTCGVPTVLTKDRTNWRCRICKVTMSIRHKSFFKEKRLPLTTVLEVLYWWSLDTKQSVICREVGISRFMIGNWFQYCRRLCEQFFKDHPCLLGGPGKVVEVDTCDFSSSEGDSSLRILGMVERRSRSVFLTILPNRHLRTVVHFVEKVVQPGTKVMSNASPSYKTLCSRPGLHFVGVSEANFSTAAVVQLWRCVRDSLRRKVVRNELALADLKEIQFRLLMGDRVFGELLYWLDFYRW